MAILNLLGIYFLANVLRREILSYRVDLSAGKITEAPKDLQVAVARREEQEAEVVQRSGGDEPPAPGGSTRAERT